MAADDLQADGESVDEPCGHGDDEVAVKVRREGEEPVVAGASNENGFFVMGFGMGRVLWT